MAFNLGDRDRERRLHGCREEALVRLAARAVEWKDRDRQQGSVETHSLAPRSLSGEWQWQWQLARLLAPLLARIITA